MKARFYFFLFLYLNQTFLLCSESSKYDIYMLEINTKLLIVLFFSFLLIIILLVFSIINYKEKEKRYSSLFEFSPVSLWEEDFSGLKNFLEKNISHEKGALIKWIEDKPERFEQCIGMIHIRSVNKKTIELYRGRNKEHVIRQYESLFPELSEMVFKEEIETLWNGSTRFSSDFQEKNLDGDLFYTHVNVSIVPGYEKSWKKVFVSVEDVSERIRYQEELLASLEEKKVLLKEIHHRVKNNLAIVSSFLYLQMGDIQDEKMQSILLKSQARIQSMAMIHEKLYQNDSIMNINLPEYTEDLARYLISSYETGGYNVNYGQNVANLPFIIDQLIPLGLILTEVISNSMKYAFKAVHSPVINLQIGMNEGCKVKIVISDNGSGIDEEHKKSRKNSIGMELISSLVEQLDGTIRYENKNGTEVTLEFEFNPD